MDAAFAEFLLPYFIVTSIDSSGQLVPTAGPDAIPDCIL
jgi:hypothetical protein